MTFLEEKYNDDKTTWDECAETYEKQIVGGHPDILAYEEFEEDFLDYILRYCSKIQNKPIKLLDIGCGSGRLHLRYGFKTTLPEKRKDKKNNSNYTHDPILSASLKEVWGIDFSESMLNLANEKLKKNGLLENTSTELKFEQGSAFELKEEPGEYFPIAVCLINSIGVMQGYEGAVELFKSMKKAVQSAGGIAIISNYQKKYLKNYGLGQYESTLDVSGQPVWLKPNTYAINNCIQIPTEYKRANNSDDKMFVNVYDSSGKIIKKNHMLQRDPKIVEETLNNGHIITYSNYESNWYSFEQVDEWVNFFWDRPTYHFETKYIDKIRAEPGQISIFDAEDSLSKLFQNWENNDLIFKKSS